MAIYNVYNKVDEKVKSMERKDIVTIQFHTPKQVAKQLKINPSTLRKYCGMINDATGTDFFKRDDSNARIFSDDDILLLQRVIKLKQAPSVSLKEAVEIALVDNGKLTPVTDITPRDMSIQSDKAGVMLSLQESKAIMKKQSDDIAVLLEVNQRLMDTNKELSDNVQRLLDEIQESKQKRSWLGKWFDRK